MYLGFFYICCVLGVRFLRYGVDSFLGTYDAVGHVMCFLHLLMFLEVLHPIFGYTNSSAITSFMQIIGRIIVLFALVRPEPRMQIKPVVFYMFLVWSAVEIVRYTHTCFYIILRSILQHLFVLGIHIT